MSCATMNSGLPWPNPIWRTKLRFFFLTRFLGSMLFGLKPMDPLTLTGAGLLLLVAAMLADWAPARRASRIQPVQALRHE
jgi:ABC-type lipoprotein release transport system permease subunit